MLDGADGGLCSIRMVREESFVHLLVCSTAVIGHVHILLLIHGLQLCMKQAENRISETFTFDLQPTFYLIVWNILLIYSHIVGSKGICTLCTDHGHHLVVLVRNSVFGCLVRNGVDLMIDGLALRGVSGVVIDLIQSFYLLQLLLLFRPVQRTKVIGTLEHKVFKIMRETRGFGRVILAAHTHRNIGLDARHILIHRHEHLQSVVERVMNHVHRVILICFLFVVLGIYTDSEETECCCQKAHK